MDIARKNYEGIPRTGSPHFHAVRAGNLLFLAGATAKMPLPKMEQWESKRK